MLKIIVPATEQWDNEKQEFISTKEQTLELEHSLVSLSKWESKWCKPFLSRTDLSVEENLDYIRCMTLTKNVDPNVYLCLSNENLVKIQRYINAPMTATVIRDTRTAKKSNEQYTSELIYYYMFASQIPIDCEKWHLNRLITLIKIFGIKSEKPKPMSRKEALSQQASLNAARRKQLNSKG